ncbi:hypothetical protein E2C01_065304 [Portunus trituberculatus]|uniref:Uncharacterized protein n=1 Tax=Portunus trituberculatus TaxID=210409 RepID=A0A5B7HM75_PORTR|nr:hypothetical protein [Portunus trituberculatus]
MDDLEKRKKPNIFLPSFLPSFLPTCFPHLLPHLFPHLLSHLPFLFIQRVRHKVDVTLIDRLAFISTREVRLPGGRSSTPARPQVSARR